MIYLKRMQFLNSSQEYDMIIHKMNIHNSVYPLNIFPQRQLEAVSFQPITLFCGGNGCGKTTILNIIADGANAERKNPISKGEMFDRYVRKCRDNFEFHNLQKCVSIKYLSSDDVFDYLLDVRAINSDVNRRKNALIEEYWEHINTPFETYDSSWDQYDRLKDKVDANRMTVSGFVRSRLRNNTVASESNGETALDFWQREISEDSLYIIDEPENSLSPENQLKLKEYIEQSARFYNCQFIIATHSPFLQAMKDAVIYDLDEVPVRTKKWTELESVKVYEQFFREYGSEFEEQK